MILPGFNHLDLQETLSVVFILYLETLKYKRIKHGYISVRLSVDQLKVFSANDYRVSTLSKNVTGIIMQSLKLSGQF